MALSLKLREIMLQKLYRKWIEVPVTNEVEFIEAVQLWEVRWLSRHNEYGHGTREEMEAFTSEQAANHYATALRNAFKLLRHTSGTHVSVKKAGGDAMKVVEQQKRISNG